MARRVLSLLLVLTQAATMFAGPAFTLCISPKGHVCIDALWADCTCCQDESDPVPDTQIRGSVDDSVMVCGSEKRCSCHCGRDDPPPSTTLKAAAADPVAAIWHGKPCRCEHIPLLVAPDGQQPVVERTAGHDLHGFDQLLFTPTISQFGGFSPSRNGVALHPIPPPFGHLRIISCTVLRC